MWRRIKRLEWLAAIKRLSARKWPAPILRWPSREEYAASKKGVTVNDDGSLDVTVAWPEDTQKDGPPYDGPREYGKVG
jgi:hypothetical protein